MQTEKENHLSIAHCEACRVDAPKITDSEITILIQQIPNWIIIDSAGIKQLSRTINVKDFQSALALTQKIGELAEQENHHPAITTEWGKVTVQWWTHKIGGLHRNDFIMAAKTDKIIESC